jgi:hypothetical protein
LKHSFNLPVLLAAFLVISFVNSGCKENILINSNISPADNALGVFDTSLSCITHTYYDDSAVTGFYVAGFPVIQGVGAVTDPFFGTMTGATHFQVQPFNASILVYKDKTIDSAVLVLPYSGYTYGDTADQTLTQTYQAFFLNEDLTNNFLYYSSTVKQLDIANPLSNPVTVNLYHLKDSVSVKGKNYHPGLRIKLNRLALLNRLMPALTLATGSTTPNVSFHSVFKGVCVKVADSRFPSKAYPFFRLDGSNGSDDYSGAGIIVYYHDNANPTIDTLSELYYFNGENCGFFNSVSKTYGHSPVNSLYTSVQPGDSVVGMQNQPGASIDVVIPGIKSLPSGMINKAELQITVLPNYKDNKFTPISRIYPRRVSNGSYPAGTTAGAVSEVLDRFSGRNALSVIDGTLHTFNRNGTNVETYTINIPREVMSSFTAKNDTLHLRLTGTQDYVGAFRLIAAGGNHPNSIFRAKLFVVYSALN